MSEPIPQDSPPTVGGLLQSWRRRRRLSQLDLAAEAGVSQRHLSFIESGRAAPSRAMVLRLAERLDVPARDCNQLLLAAGFAPAYREHGFQAAAFGPARQAVGLILSGFEPFPALAVDRHWVMQAHNRLIPALMQGVAPALAAPPVNVLRLSLHPDGLAPRIANYREWRAHVVERLGRQIAQSGDPVLMALQAEIKSYPVPWNAAPPGRRDPGERTDIAVPFDLDSPVGRLSFLTTTTVFGTAVDLTLSELAIESFLPADEATAVALRTLVGQL